MRTWVTDGGLKELQGLTHLEQLDLGGTRVTDAGLACVAKMARLEALDVLRPADLGRRRGKAGGIDAPP